MVWTCSSNGTSLPLAPDDGMGSGWAPEKGQTTTNLTRECNRTKEGGGEMSQEGVDNHES
jgi:hypothetical protein